jgi:hypothetical protein
MMLNIDEELYKSALRYGKPNMNDVEFLKEILSFYIRAQAGRDLSELGGKAPNMKAIPR